MMVDAASEEVLIDGGLECRVPRGLVYVQVFVADVWQVLSTIPGR